MFFSLLTKPFHSTETALLKVHNNILVITKHRHRKGHSTNTSAFSVAVSTIWNSLPEHVKSTNNIVFFPPLSENSYSHMNLALYLKFKSLKYNYM